MIMIRNEKGVSDVADTFFPSLLAIFQQIVDVFGAISFDSLRIKINENLLDSLN